MARDDFTNVLITANPYCSVIRDISYCAIDDLTLDELSKDVETNRSLTPRIHTALYNVANFIPDIHRLRVLAFNASFCDYTIERRVSRDMSKPKDIREWSLGSLRNIFLLKNKNEHVRTRSPKTLSNLNYNRCHPFQVQVFKRRKMR